MSAMSELEKLKKELARQAENVEEEVKAAQDEKEYEFLRGKAAGLWAAWAAVDAALLKAYKGE
jgi:hypothetical protein